jgi:hypothetical protein
MEPPCLLHPEPVSIFGSLFLDTYESSYMLGDQMPALQGKDVRQCLMAQ